MGMNCDVFCVLCVDDFLAQPVAISNPTSSSYIMDFFLLFEKHTVISKKGTALYCYPELLNVYLCNSFLYFPVFLSFLSMEYYCEPNFPLNLLATYIFNVQHKRVHKIILNHGPGKLNNIKNVSDKKLLRPGNIPIKLF